MGTTLTFAWGRGNTDKVSCFNKILSSLCSNTVLGRIVPVVHLISVHVWKLKYWKHAFPPSEDPGGSGTIPIDAIQDILGCDAQTLFTWVGLRGEVMRKISGTEIKPVYKEYPSTYVPLVVMLSLWMYERLGQAAAAAKANAAKAKPDGSPDPSPSAKRADVQGLLEKSSQLIQFQYKWIRGTITDQAWFKPIFYAVLVWTPVRRGQVDLWSFFYLWLLVCFMQKQSERLWWQRPMVWTAEHQMGILLFILWGRYAVYLGRPPDCSWTHPTWMPPWMPSVTRDHQLRLWLGIANECVISRLSYQPCPVFDMLWDYSILLIMACYQRGKGHANFEAQQDQKDLKYGENWPDHLTCLFWSSGGVFCCQISLSIAVLLLWSDVNNVWMCWFTWLALRMFRHDSARARLRPERLSSNNRLDPLLKNDAKMLFVWSCSAMVIYSVVQSPLASLFLQWVGWKHDDACAAYVDLLSALMNLGGVPSSTFAGPVDPSSGATKTEPYLTALATISLIAIALKAVLKGQGQRKALLRPHVSTATEDDISANYVLRRKKHRTEEDQPESSLRTTNSNAVQKMLYFFEGMHTYVQDNFIDKAMHQEDSKTVKSGLHDAEGRDRSADIRVVGILSVVILGALGCLMVFVHTIAGVVYFVLLGVALLVGGVYLFILNSYIQDVQDRRTKEFVRSCIRQMRESDTDLSVHDVDAMSDGDKKELIQGQSEFAAELKAIDDSASLHQELQRMLPGVMAALDTLARGLGFISSNLLVSGSNDCSATCFSRPNQLTKALINVRREL